jgi:hypothetical protein
MPWEDVGTAIGQVGFDLVSGKPDPIFTKIPILGIGPHKVLRASVVVRAHDYYGTALLGVPLKRPNGPFGTHFAHEVLNAVAENFIEDFPQIEVVGKS